MMTTDVRQATLSERAVRILALIEMGLDNAEIAELLGVTRNTLKTHIRRTYRTLGVASRAEATAWVEGCLPRPRLDQAGRAVGTDA
jgi:DNA-binding NarL/FixJ family response regulator